VTVKGNQTLMLCLRPCLMMLFLIPMGVASAETPVADAEHPCVQEICIGDGLDRLRAIDWAQVDYTSERVKRVRRHDRERRARIYPGFGRDGVPSYLIVGQFDGDLLDDMARVKAACEPNEIKGTYLSKGGHKTDVRVSLLPSENNTGAMSWRVVGIGRLYSGFESNSQRMQLNEDLNTRYGRFLNRQPSGAMIVPMGKETVLSLHWVDVARDRRFGTHPLCDKPRRISVD
jgi:hypothetical protein